MWIPRGNVFFLKTNGQFFRSAAWNYAQQHNTEIGWDLVTLCPPFVRLVSSRLEILPHLTDTRPQVFGPVLHTVSSPAHLNTSVKEFYDAVIAHTKSAAVLSTFQGSWIDVRDVAEAHVRALEREEAGGLRFIIAAGTFVWQDWCKWDAVSYTEFAFFD